MRSDITLTTPQRLIFACLKDLSSPAEIELLANQLAGHDWDEFAILAIHQHKLAPRIWAKLKPSAQVQTPVDIADRFAESTRKTALNALILKAETAHIIAALNSVEIEPVILKGWALEEDLFGSIGKRMMYDLDLMVSPTELSKAARHLHSIGYYCELDALFTSEKRLAFALKFVKDFTFRSAQSSILLELHVRPTHIAQLLPVRDLTLRSQAMKVAGTGFKFRMLSDRSCFLYLTLHGCIHQWERAKWLCDISPLVHRMTDEDWVFVSDASKRLLIEPAVGTALVLARDLLDVPIPAQASELLEKADGSFAHKVSLRQILKTGPLRAKRSFFDWLFVFANDVRLSGQLGVKLGSVTRWFVAPCDIAEMQMPERLLPLHYLLTPYHFSRRVVRALFVR